MYSYSIPIMANEKLNKEDALKAIKKAKASYVYLCPQSTSVIKGNNDKQIEILRDLVPFFRENGLKVGVWIWSLWVYDFEKDNINDYVMVNHKGEPRVMGNPINSNEKVISGFICPTNKDSVKFVTDYIREIAKLGPDMILFDDDCGYASYLHSIGCYCERHLKLISERLGYEISREELSREVTSAKPNNVRTEWYKLIGETLEGYAAEIRKTVDSVNPEIRFGLCSVMSNWCADGTTAERLVKIFAGNTKPFLRLIGAPYWALLWDKQRLHYILEYSRMEASLVEDKNIEIFAEGDVYPRPRYQIPANYLEIFDTALRAVKCVDGCHKYMLDYTSKVDYETGYIDRHVKNIPIYDEIDRIFGNKNLSGVRVYEFLHKVPEADFTGIENPHEYATNLFFSPAAKLLSNSAVPSIYEGNNGVGIAFGENARHLPEEAFENGLILDVRAAKILMEKGVDVGIESVGENLVNNSLYFPAEDDYVVTGYAENSAYEMKLKNGAEVVVYSENEGTKERFADAFHYTNANGQKFLVFGFDGAFTDERRYRNYCTQRQLCSSIEWLQGKKMTAKCLGNPDLYLLTKENEEGLAIGLWNIFADEILKPVIELSNDYKEAEFIHCTGTLKDGKIELSEIPAFSFAFVNLKK